MPLLLSLRLDMFVPSSWLVTARFMGTLRLVHKYSQTLST